MADFELSVNSRAFANLGVRLDFDEDRYGSLLDELASNVPADASPLVKISPAPVWGMSKTREFIAMAAYDSDTFAQGNYDASTHSVSLKVDKDQEASNGLLLGATKRWSSHLNGDLARHNAERRSGRYLRGGIFVSGTASASVAGYEFIGGDSGALVGGLIGAMVLITAGISDSYRSTYNTQIREFVRDPNVVEEFGHIISYEAA